MDLLQTLDMSFNTEEVVFLRAFFRQGIQKLGQGEFKDQIEKIQRRFEEAIMRSQIYDIDPKKIF